MNDHLLKYRERFPILARTNYLISNSLGAMPAETHDAVQEYTKIWEDRGVRAWEEKWWEMVTGAGNLVAPLLGAGEGEVAFMPNVTTSHAIIFSAFDYRDRPKVVTDEMHFPSVLYLLKGQEGLGAEIEVVPSEDGISVDTEKIVAAIDEKTAYVNISHVLFKSAYIHDVKSIAEKAHECGALVIIDGYQAVGTVPVDVHDIGADVYMGGCLKWLCGGPGSAFLWVRPDIIPELKPRFTGWFSHTDPFAFDTTHEQREDIWKFLNGTPPIPALYAIQPGLRIINEIGAAAIREKSMHQTKNLIELAEAKGYKCNAPADPERRGGTVAVDVEHAREISKALKAREIICDFRVGAGIRLSPHFYNTDSELEDAVNAIADILETGEWKNFSSASTVT
ncbi:MAG: aminotransferase class V-fold PLP-dependent enzyme [Planctomycetota bacterium]|nr:MAG: aminotransferase class V-fold PLP-dependent enzyme [Planctomycetota bacterium]